MTAERVTGVSSPSSPDEPASSGRSRMRLLLMAEWPLSVVLLGVGTGLIVIANHHFRAGSLIVGGAVFVAAVLRLFVPSRRAGLLVVRSRTFDVTVLAVLGLAILSLGLAVPP